jgi:hypothetical protein
MEGSSSCVVWSPPAAAAAAGLGEVTAAAAATAATITAADEALGASTPPPTAGGVQWSAKGKKADEKWSQTENGRKKSWHNINNYNYGKIAEVKACRLRQNR